MEKEEKVVKKVSAKPKTATKTKEVKTGSPKTPQQSSGRATKVKSNKIAVILTGGKQYLVREGDVLKIEKIKDLDKNAEIVFDKVLLVADDKNVKVGTDLVAGAKVTAKSEGDIRDKKVTVIKYKCKTRYTVKRGHRQTHTYAVVTSIK